MQPVTPFSPNQEWNVISRTILPVVYQDDAAGVSGSQFGSGDVVQSLADIDSPCGGVIRVVPKNLESLYAAMRTH